MKVDDEVKPSLSKTIFNYRLTDDYLPEKKKKQDYSCPKSDLLSFDRHIIGVVDYGNL